MVSTFASSLRAYLEPVANWFGQFGMPDPIIHWGHPLMMGIVVFVMGSAAAFAGWQIRTAEGPEAAAPGRAVHKRIALWMLTFVTLGYTGGLLSLVMQGEPILSSPHFWTGTAVIGMLGLNGAISLSKFGGGKESLRSVHAYLGTAAVALMFVHAFLGLNLGLSI